MHGPAIRLFRGRRVILHANIIDQATGPVVVAVGAVRAIRVRWTSPSSSPFTQVTLNGESRWQVEIGDNRLIEDGEPVFFSPFVAQPLPIGSKSATLPSGLSATTVYYARRVPGSTSRIWLYSDALLSKVRDLVDAGKSGSVGVNEANGRGNVLLLYGNRDALFTFMGNTVTRSIRGQQLRGMYLGNSQLFRFTDAIDLTAVPPRSVNEYYTVPEGAGFFGQVVIANNFMSATDGHVVVNRPAVSTNAPLILFNNRGLDGANAPQPLSPRSEGVGTGRYELQGMTEDLEALALAPGRNR